MSDSLWPHGLQHARPPSLSQLLESTQTHVHRVSDAIQPSHALSSPIPPAFNLSQHQGLFQWVSSLHQVAKLLEFQLQHQSFQWTSRIDFLWDGMAGPPCSPRDAQQSSPPPQFKSINSSVLSFLYTPTPTSKHDYWNTIALTRWTIFGKVMSLLFNMLSSLVITFHPRSKCLLTVWLQSPSAVILEPPKISLSLIPLFAHLFAMKCWDQMPHDLNLSECWVLSQIFNSPLSLSSRGSLVLLYFLP